MQLWDMEQRLPCTIKQNGADKNKKMMGRFMYREKNFYNKLKQYKRERPFYVSV